MKKVVIEDMSYEGAGVAKDGKVIFVPKTLVGETVEIEIVKENSKFAQGRLLSVVSPSVRRCRAKCPHYDICGGCDFQHCDYDMELFLKMQILKRELCKLDQTIDIDDSAFCSRFGYRNKIKLEVKDNKIGYFKSKSHEFFEIDVCPIATEQINEAIKILKDYFSIAKYKGLKSIYIKQFEKEIAICFLFDKNFQKMGQKLIKNEKIMNFSVFFAYGDVLESNKTQILCIVNKGKLLKKYKNIEIESEVSAFNQINDEVAEKLYDYILSETKNMRVVNAYSGQGLLTALIANHAKFVYGIEYQASAHKMAQRLTENFQNVENICGLVEDSIAQILRRDRIDIIVLDPARDGCKKSVLEEIKLQKIKKIAYISCNFSTLTRDLMNLQENYLIEKIKIFDMFPCTANMEVVAILNLK